MEEYDIWYNIIQWYDGWYDIIWWNESWSSIRLGSIFRLTGDSDWSSETISVWVQDRFCNSQAHAAVASHLSTLFLHCFLSAKPARAAVGRGTGVASVCEWCLGLAVFHRFLGPLLSALAGKNVGKPDASQPVEEPKSADADARISANVILIRRLSWCCGKFVHRTFGSMCSLMVADVAIVYSLQ